METTSEPQILTDAVYSPKRRHIRHTQKPLVTMDDLTFLRDATRGNVEISIAQHNGQVKFLTRLNIDTIRKHCPLLAIKLEDDGHSAELDEQQLYDHGQVPLRYTFSDCDVTAVICFLRYLYIEDYTYCEAGLEKPCSLLLHLQIYQLAKIWQVDTLQLQVCEYINQEAARFSDQDSPPMHDFLEGIRLLYTDLRDEVDLRGTVAYYCVARFDHPQVGPSEKFRQTAYESPLFHRDLVHANSWNGFSTAAGQGIIQLPVCSHALHNESVDFQCYLHCDEALSDNRASVPQSWTRDQIRPLAELKRTSNLDTISTQPIGNHSHSAQAIGQEIVALGQSRDEVHERDLGFRFSPIGYTVPEGKAGSLVKLRQERSESPFVPSWTNTPPSDLAQANTSLPIRLARESDLGATDIPSEASATLPSMLHRRPETDQTPRRDVPSSESFVKKLHYRLNNLQDQQLSEEPLETSANAYWASYIERPSTTAEKPSEMHGTISQLESDLMGISTSADVQHSYTLDVALQTFMGPPDPANGRCRCQHFDCRKLFKDSDFLKKHILNKHARDVMVQTESGSAIVAMPMPGPDHGHANAAMAQTTAVGGNENHGDMMDVSTTPRGRLSPSLSVDTDWSVLDTPTSSVASVRDHSGSPRATSSGFQEDGVSDDDWIYFSRKSVAAKEE